MNRGLPVGKKERESTYQFPNTRKQEICTTTWKCEDIDKIFVRIGKRKQQVWLTGFIDPVV